MEDRTGDIVLFSRRRAPWFHPLSVAIDFFTESQFSHVGMVLHNPTWLHPSLRGEFLWQSTSTSVANAEDPAQHVFGVQITPLMGAVHGNRDYTLLRRAVHCGGADVFTHERLRDIHAAVHARPYDVIPSHWIDAALHRGTDPGPPSTFFCSALLGYILMQLGCIPPSTNWRLLRPCDFSSRAPVLLPFQRITYGQEKAL